jgi:hypothetical protein
MQHATLTQLETDVSSSDSNDSSTIELKNAPAAPATHFSAAYISLLGSALLAACGGNDGSSGSSNNNSASSDSTSLSKSDSANASRSNTVGADASVSNQNGSIDGYRPPDAVANLDVSSAAGFNNFPIAYTPNDAVRFLLQSQFNATDAEITAVSSGTYASYLQQQFAKPIGQTGWDWLEARGYGTSDANNYFFNTPLNSCYGTSFSQRRTVCASVLR